MAGLFNGLILRNPLNDIVKFKGKTYVRHPWSKKNYRRNYFVYKSKTENLVLHREVWKSCNGEIPNGFVIHHIDHNPLNNEISNLVAVSDKEHRLLHRSENTANGINTGHYGSSEKQKIRFREWYNKTYPNGPKARKPVNNYKKYQCILCTTWFVSNHKRHSVFCSIKCRSTNYRKRKQEGIPPFKRGRPRQK